MCHWQPQAASVLVPMLQECSTVFDKSDANLFALTVCEAQSVADHLRSCNSGDVGVKFVLISREWFSAIATTMSFRSPSSKALPTQDSGLIHFISKARVGFGTKFGFGFGRTNGVQSW